MLKRFTLLITCIGLMLTFSSTLAHGFIVRAVPEDRAVLERAPTRLQYWFSEALEPDFSSVNVRDQNGAIIASGGISSENNALMTVSLPRDLPDGAYIVELRPAFASDGHVVAESRVFFVGQEVGGVTGSAADTRANTLEVIWRALTLNASLLLFGLLTLYAGVLVPAWGNRDYAAGLLPPRVMRRLYWSIGAALALALLGNVLALIQQSMAFFNTGVVQVFEGGLWNLVRIGSRFGDVWNFRVAFLLIIAAMFGAALYYRTRQPAMVRPFLTASAWMAALVLGTFSAVSHAAGAQILPWVGVTFDWLHITAVGFWAGGLMALVMVMPAALRPLEGEARRLALSAVLKRFSRWAVAALAVVITTGIYNSTTWVNSPSTAASSFGGALALKLALVAGLVAVGAAHHIALRPERYARFASVIERVRGFVPTLRLEVILAVLVIAAAALLTATPVPTPDSVAADVPAPTDEQPAGPYTVRMTVTPGGPGINSYDLQVRQGDASIDGLTVRVRHVYPSLDLRSALHTADSIDGGTYATTDGDIDRAGQWWSLVDLQDAEGQTYRAAFAWDIRAEAAVQQTRPPGLINLAALALTLGAVGGVFYPAATRFARRMDLSPLMIGVGVWAVVGTVIFMVIGYLILDETQRGYETVLTPPPAVINPVLPSQDSLTRGQSAFESACAGWEGAALDELRQRLPRTRDEELFSFVREGWRSLPACAAQDEPAQWDIVNYVRTFEVSTP